MGRFRRNSKKFGHWLKQPFTSHRPKPESTATTHVSPTQDIAESEASAPESVQDDTQAKLARYNALENLPAEIRRHILFTLEYQGLNALVHASPVYHQQYLLDRQRLLCNCLEEIFGSTTVDAYAVYQSSLNFSETRTEDKIIQFLGFYQDRRSLSKDSFLKTLILDEVISIITFHFSTIKPLARWYTDWALNNLTKETMGIQSHEPLSRTEETRLVRALYRFQLYCDLFGDSHYARGRIRRLDFRSTDVLRIFFCIYEPWEVEEIACIYTFAREMYDQIFDDIHENLEIANPGLDFASKVHWKSYLQGTTSRGLKLLRYVLILRILNGNKTLVSTLKDKITMPGSKNFEAILDSISQSLRRMEHPLDQDLKQQRRDPLLFQDDDGDHPPLAWTLIWRGTYSNLFGWYIDDVIRLWGYIMWDAARLECTGGRGVLARQWEARWEDFDPRDGL